MKKNFTLIELVLSLTLFSLLLTTLFFSYTSLKRKMPRESHEERYFDQKVATLFKRLDDKGAFVGEEKSFCFIFDQGASQNPLLAGKVLAKLYFDPSTHTLALTYWPHPSTKELSPSATIVLLENVDDLRCAYYFPPKSLKTPVQPDRVGDYPQIGWQTAWKKNYLTVPTFIKMTLLKEGEELPFVFDLPPYKVRGDI